MHHPPAARTSPPASPGCPTRAWAASALALLALLAACGEGAGSEPIRGSHSPGGDTHTGARGSIDALPATDTFPGWAAPVPIPPRGTPVQDTACVSASIPSGTSKTAIRRRAAFFEAMKALGVHSVRQHFLWSSVEPAEGKWSRASTDRIVAAADAAKIELIGLLGYGVPWASTKGAAAGDPHYPPDDPASFATYAAEVTARYASSVHRWEVWNEQNAGYRFWKGGGVGGDPKAYAELLLAARQAIAQAAPGATVSYGGLFYYPQLITGAEDFLAQSLAALPAAATAFDALAFHPYPPYPPTLAPEDAPEAGPGAMQRYAFDVMVQRLRSILAAAGRLDVPVWITELGWPVGLPLSPDRVARFLVRGDALLLAAGVDALCWYTYMDHPPDHPASIPWEGLFGLYEWSDTAAGAPLRPKAAAEAHAVFFSTLAGTRFAADERGGRDWQQLAFADDTGRVVRILWDWQQPEGASRTVSFPAAEHRRYRVIGMYGDEAPVAVGPAHMVTLPISATPVYVVSVPVP